MIATLETPQKNTYCFNSCISKTKNYFDAKKDNKNRFPSKTVYAPHQ